MQRFSLTKCPLDNKTVFLRTDYNVPIEKGKVVEDYRIKASLPTIKFLLKKKCKIIIGCHLGRPQGKVVANLRLDPIAKVLKKLLPKVKITKLDDCIGREIKEIIDKGKSGEIFLLENLRFYKEEKENDPAFAHSLANLAEIYVNDAFANCHRKHASMEAITKFLPSLPGFLVEKEIADLGKALNPTKPLVWVLGGAKLDKVELLEKVLSKADYVLIGGALAFPFLKAKGIPVGMSKVDSKSVKVAKKFLKSKRIILPVDFVVTDKFSSQSKASVVGCDEIGNHQIGLDLGPETIKLFKMYLRKALTIVWNGPLGYFEWAKYANSTKEIGRYIGKLSAHSICGGGETAEAIRKFHLTDKFTHVSTGGGAALTLLSGKKLVAVEALEDNFKAFSR